MRNPRVLNTVIPAIILVSCFTAGCSAEAKRERVLKKAESYFKAGEFEKAKIEYSNVLHADPKNRAAIEKIGLIWLEEGSPLRAFPYLVKMRELDPYNYALRTKLARAYMALGKVGEARKEATEILEKFSDGGALMLLAETVRSPAELEATQKALRDFPNTSTTAFHVATAHFLVRKGDLAGSQRSAERALASDPKSGDAHAAMAIIRARQGKPDQVAEELKLAAELSPVRADARLTYVDFLLSSGKLKEASAYVEGMIAKEPNYVPARRLAAQIKYVEKNYDAAHASLKEVFVRDPANPEALLLQAHIWIAQRDVKKATERLEQLSTQYPGLAVVKHTLARVYLEGSKVGKAEAALVDSLRYNPEHVESALLLAEIRLRAGDFQAVGVHMMELLKTNPLLVSAQDLLIEALLGAEQFDAAEKFMREQVRLNPTRPEPHIALARLYRQQNKLTDARASIEKSIELAPDSLPAFSELISLDIAEKNYSAGLARIAAKQTSAISPSILKSEEARIHVAKKDWATAETTLLALLEADPGFTRAYEMLAQIYNASQRAADGIARMQALLSKNPQNERALELTALLYLQLKDHPRAQQAFEKIVAQNPESILALNNLACLYHDELGEPAKGVVLAEKAWALAPLSAAVADTLGWMYYRRGDFQKALPLLQESARRAPKEPEILFHLAMALEKNGDAAAARTVFHKALSSTSDFAWKAEAQQRLAALEVAGEKAPATSAPASKSTTTKQE